VIAVTTAFFVVLVMQGNAGGSGRLLTQFSFAIRQDLPFATVFIVAALGVVMYGVVSLLQRWIVWWRE
jgi:ABC-type nitrate/sulfonate/bicarbonate transport system permease component